MLVILFQVHFVYVWVDVSLPAVIVFVFVLDMFVIMQDVCVRMRHIAMSVFVGVLRRIHGFPPWLFCFASFRPRAR